ncbi:hypothetical protein [Cellulomonas marina]|uniref:Uncharacterized protein n=1 Tax=Cellulomonas marina TaxID=988821 RepID=A0A1I0V045_9CELL|nr:hypothetical protein [Cellulomonas marina]GIG29898.1 hypothetical protein Cma02nite_24980 [Cellulomonas marina]SFA69397.1 hypothetical protein SAMN05421867_10139 [Cellulomonas marina]
MPPAEGRDAPPRRVAALALAVGLLAPLVAWLRLPPVARGTLWAEDGAVFLAGAAAEPVGTAWLRPYDGYLHLVPRVLADLVTGLLPAPAWALGTTAAACALAGVVAALVVLLSGGLGVGLPARGVLGLLTVGVPGLPVEVLGNLANAHALLLWLVPWLLVHRVRSRSGAVGVGLVALVVALSEVQAVVLAPLGLWRLRDRAGLPARLGLALGLAAQAVAVLGTDRSPALGDAPAGHLVALALGAGVLLPLWTGQVGAGSWLLAHAGPVALGAAVLLAAVPSLLALVAARRADGGRRALLVALPVGAVALWAVAVLVNRPPLLLPAGPGQEGPVLTVLRYAPAVELLLAAALVLAAGGLRARRGGQALVAGGAALLLLAALAGARPEATTRSTGPLWEPGARGAATSCARPGASATVPVPVAPAPTWVAVVPCSEVTEG